MILSQAYNHVSSLISLQLGNGASYDQNWDRFLEMNALLLLHISTTKLLMPHLNIPKTPIHAQSYKHERNKHYVI